MASFYGPALAAGALGNAFAGLSKGWMEGQQATPDIMNKAVQYATGLQGLQRSKQLLPYEIQDMQSLAAYRKMAAENMQATAASKAADDEQKRMKQQRYAAGINALASSQTEDDFKKVLLQYGDVEEFQNSPYVKWRLEEMRNQGKNETPQQRYTRILDILNSGKQLGPGDQQFYDMYNNAYKGRMELDKARRGSADASAALARERAGALHPTQSPGAPSNPSAGMTPAQKMSAFTRLSGQAMRMDADTFAKTLKIDPLAFGKDPQEIRQTLSWLRQSWLNDQLRQAGLSSFVRDPGPMPDVLKKAVPQEGSAFGSWLYENTVGRWKRGAARLTGSGSGGNAAPGEARGPVPAPTSTNGETVPEPPAQQVETDDSNDPLGLFH